jgi:hypothetical protein
VLLPTSPKSIEACFRLGIDPLELAFKPATAFKKPGESDELVNMRLQHHEQLRQVRMAPRAADALVLLVCAKAAHVVLLQQAAHEAHDMLSLHVDAVVGAGPC